MTFVVLFLMSVFDGYSTIIGIENVNRYHVETNFLPLDSTLISEHQLCNATYSARNIFRQIASKPNITGPFTILCNISENQTANALQTCVDVFADIEIEFSCYNSYYGTNTWGTFFKLMMNKKTKLYWVSYNINNTTGVTCGATSAYPYGAPEIIPSFWWENFTASYPYDNGTLDVNYICSISSIYNLKLPYQSNNANWSYCEDSLWESLPNCSVACIGHICSIYTGCFNDIDPICLISKYMDMYIRTIYECVNQSNLTTDAVFDSSLTTSKDGITTMKAVSNGPIIGSTIGVITFAAVTIELLNCFRRY